MVLLTSEMKMADVIHFNYLLIPLFKRFGIRLGFGDKTIKAVCKEQGINIDFFLTIINIYSNKNYFPEKKLQEFNIVEFLTYLRKNHQYYLYNQVPAIERLIDTLIQSCSENGKNLELVRDFFHSYKCELEEHLNREETITFPYIESLYLLYHNNFDTGKYLEISSHYSMKRFSDEHDNIDLKLFDLQNILIKYMNGNFDEDLTHTILFELFRLESDIKNHTRLEERILKPMVVEIEQNLKEFIQ
jgi:regulator of cell morphogenesis and NO signaling